MTDMHTHRDHKRSKYRKQAALGRSAPKGASFGNLDRSRPGLFVTCPRGKERKTLRDALDLLEHLVQRCYPGRAGSMDDDDDDAEDVDEADIEQQMQRELNALNNNGSAAGPSSFVPIQLNCECVIFFAAPSDVDPVRICEAAVQDLLETGSTRSTNILRLTPVTGLCSSADLNAFDALATATLQPLFSNPPPGVRWRIDYNHRAYQGPLSRDLATPRLGNLVTSLLPTDRPHDVIVDLSRPTHVIIVELFKHICGISLVSAEWYEGPPIPVAMEGGKVRGGQYRRFGIGSLADDLVKARAKAKKEVVQSPTSENKMDMS